MIRVMDSGGNAKGEVGPDQDKPSEIVVFSYVQEWQSTFVKTDSTGNQPHVVGCPGTSTNLYYQDWIEDGSSGAYYIQALGAASCCETDWDWPPDKYILNVQSPSQLGSSTSTCGASQTNLPPPTVPLEHCDVATNGLDGCGTNSFMRQADTDLVLWTGGKALSSRRCICGLSGSAYAVTNITTMTGYWVPSGQIEAGTFGVLV